MEISFSKKLKELRTEKNLTQKKLGEIFNVSSATISDWEIRGYEPSYQVLANLAHFFNITVGQLLGIEEY